MIAKQDFEQESLETTDEIKIYFCSRTHSQLTQFANEVRRVKIPPYAAEGVEEKKRPDTKTIVAREIKYLSLGSRKNLCVNPKVSKLGSAAAINERCLELQQTSTSSDHKCVFLPDKENESLVNEFRDHALANIRDIEDLGMLGKRIGICPYYASRAVIRPSEVSSVGSFVRT